MQAWICSLGFASIFTTEIILKSKFRFYKIGNIDNATDKDKTIVIVNFI
jgi:hypothetical protein